MNRLKSVSQKLATMGKRLPSKQEFENVWGAGELAAPVPALDLDLHEAVVQTRLRTLTATDVKNGIKLESLAIDTSNIAPVPDAHEMEPEQVEAFVDDFFNALDAANYGQAEEENTQKDTASDTLSNDALTTPNDKNLSHDKETSFSDESQDNGLSITTTAGQNTPMLDLSILDSPAVQQS